MADDKFTDDDKADESTPEQSTSGLADDAAPTGATAADLTASDESGADNGEGVGVENADAAELSEDDEIVDPLDTADDEYVDDPATDDINEAKLERATDQVAGEGVEDTGVSSPTRSRTTRPVKKSEKAAEAELEPTGKAGKKAVAHRSRSETGADAGSGRVGPVAFVGESAAELKKVVWPTGTEVRQYFVVVLVFVLFIMGIVMGLDLLYGWAILSVFG